MVRKYTSSCLVNQPNDIAGTLPSHNLRELHSTSTRDEDNQRLCKPLDFMEEMMQSFILVGHNSVY